MFIYSDDMYYSSALEGIPGLVHGFSSRTLGDARRDDRIRTVMSRVSSTYPMFPVRAEQVHGNTVAAVDTFTDAFVAGADGLVGDAAGLSFAIRVADCVPVLLADGQSGAYAAVHAGWKGTLSHIVTNAVRAMVARGARLRHIRAAIGPHIGRCCYEVPDDRLTAFSNEFGNTSGVISSGKNGGQLDIGLANYLELLHAGVTRDHIDAPVFCTSCQNDRFYSYRKDTKETFGEIIGVIGRIPVA